MVKRIGFLLLVAVLAGSLYAAPKKITRITKPVPKPATKLAPKPEVKAVASLESIQRAHQLLVDGRVSEAAADLKKLIDSGTAPVLAYALMADAQRRLGNTAEVAEALDTFLEKANPKDPIEAAFVRSILGPRVHSDRRWSDRSAYIRDAKRYLPFIEDINAERNLLNEFPGMIQGGEKEIEEGIQIFRSLYERYPKEKAILNLLANLYVRRGKSDDESLKFLLKAVELYPQEESLWSSLARVYRIAKNNNKALEAFTKAKSLSNNYYYDVELAHIYMEMGRNDEAVRLLKTCYEKNNDFYALMTMGNDLIGMSSDPASLESLRQFFEKRLAAEPDNSAVLLSIARVLKMQEKETEHLTAIKKLIESVKDVNMMENIARMLGEMGSYDASIDLYAKLAALQSNRDFSWGVINSADRMLNEGKAKEAMAIYRKALAGSLVKPDRISYICDRLNNAQMAKEADAILKEALEKYPDDLTLKRTYARSLSNQGKSAEAFTMLKKMALENRTDSNSDSILYEVAEKAGKLKDLISDCQACAVKHPNDAGIHLLLGRLHMGLKDYPAALSEYRKANELSPDNSGTRVALAQALETAGSDAEAIKLWVSVLEKVENSWGYRQPVEALCRLYVKTGKTQEGAVVLKKYVSAAQSDPEVLRGLMDLYMAAGRVDEAMALMPKMLENTRDQWQRRDLIRRVVEQWKKNSKIELVIQALKKISVSYPNDPDIAMSLGDLLLASDRLAEAAEHYTVAAANTDQLWEIMNRLLWEKRQPEMALDVLAAVRPKDENQARNLMSQLMNAMDRINNDDNYRAARVSVANKAKKYFDNIQAKFSGTDLAATAMQNAVHCTYPSRISPKRGRINEPEGLRVIAELEEIQRLYPKSSAASAAAFDMMRVYSLLKKDAERSAIQERIIAGEFGDSSTAQALRTRGEGHLNEGRYKEAVADLQKGLQITEKSSPNERWQIMQTRLLLAKAYYGAGETENAVRIAESVRDSAGQDRWMAREAEKLLMGGLQMRISPCRERVYVMKGNEVTPESAGEMTEKIHTQIVLRGFSKEPVPITLRMLVPNVQGMTAFPENGTLVADAGKRFTEWKTPIVPCAENQWESHWFGYKRTVENAVQPIKGLKVSRSCIQESPGVWVMKLSISADQRVQASIRQTVKLDFDDEALESTPKPDSVRDDSISWSSGSDGSSFKLTAKIHMTGNAPVANYIPEVRVSAYDSNSSYNGQDTREDKKAFSFRNEHHDLILTAEKDFALESYGSNETTVQLPEVRK